MQDFETLLCERSDGGVMLVRLNRPAVANALNTQMGRELLDVFQDLLLDPGALRCLIVTGAGDKAFCAGADLKERNGMTDADWRRQHAVFEQAFAAIMDCPLPVIAAVNGAAYGGGCELALAADFIYAAETARFALTETSLGIIPGCGGTQNLPRAVGARRARELIFTAAPFSAAEALTWGMVNAVLPPRELLDGARAAAARIAKNGPIAVQRAKHAINQGADSSLRTGLAMEIEAYNRTIGTMDRVEGVAAFNARRPPLFRGE